MNVSNSPINTKDTNLSFVISLQKTSFDAVASGGLDFQAKMQQMAEMGFDGVELAVRDPSGIDLAALKAALKHTGLAVPAIGTGQAYVDEGLSLSHTDKDIRKAAIARIRRHLELAAELKALVIIGLIRCPAKDTQVDDFSGWFKESLMKCLDYALEQGVLVALEPCNRYECRFINTIPEAVDLIKNLNHPQLRILADTFHMNIEDKSYRESLKSAAPHLVHVHFADSNRRFPGSGHIDFVEILKTLHEINYNGFISGEMLPQPSEFEAMRSFAAFMRK